MGRAAIFLCGGFAIILGIIQFNILNSQVSQSKLNVEYVNQSQARNMAMSGMEFGIREIMHEEGFEWRPDPQPMKVTFNGTGIDVYIDDHSTHPAELETDQIRVRAESEMFERTSRAEAILVRESIFPPIPGAMGFYGEDSQLNIGGNAKVYGEDVDPPGGAPGDGENKPGIASVIGEDELINSTGNANEIDGEPPFKEEDLDAEELQENIDNYLAEAESYTGELGTAENPKIIKLDETVKLNDEGGAGILIIPPGVTLELRGSFTFEGLVIVQGALDIRGNVTIYGSMLFGDNSLLEIEDADPSQPELSGNTTIQYSSSALANVNQKFAHKFDKQPEIVSIRD
ncbi:MAG: hypothetical protein WD266_07935 [Balneolales bacterium]